MQHTKVIVVLIALFGAMIWRTCTMPSSKDLDRNAQVSQRQKDVALVNDLNSREWKAYTMAAGQAYYAAAYQSGLYHEIGPFNSDLIAVTIDRNPRNRGINILNPQPGQTIWAPVGIRETAMAAK